MDQKLDKEQITTENIFDKIPLKDEKDFKLLAKTISKGITDSKKPKRFTYEYIKNIFELITPSLECSKIDDLKNKVISIALVNKKKEEEDKKAKGIVDDTSEPVNNYVSTKGQHNDDFFC